MRKTVNGPSGGGLKLHGAIEFPLFYGFENGIGLTSPGVLTTDTSVVYEGSQSANCNSNSDTPCATNAPSFTSSGYPISEFDFNFNEPSAQQGGGIRLWNSNGNTELGVATNNPQWEISDADGVSVVNDNTANYDSWVEVRVSFDWGAGKYDISIENPTNNIVYEDVDRNLTNGVDFSYFTINRYHQSVWDNGSTNMNYDSIEVAY